MSNLSAANLDYVLFLYTISLFILSAACFAYPFRKEADSIPFYSLGLFALFQGLAEWMNISAFAFEDSAVSMATRASALIISYFFLFDFAVRETCVLLKPVKKRVYLLPVIFCVISLPLLGVRGTISAAHFSFALFVGVYCVLIVYFYSYREKAGSSLRAFSLLMAFYFILRGLVTSKSSFFISRWINYSSFNKLSGFPVHLLLAFVIFAAGCIISIKIYHIIMEGHTRYSRRIGMIVPLSALIILIMLVSAGSALIFYGSVYTKQKQEKSARLRIRSISSHIRAVLSTTENTAYSLSISNTAKYALSHYDPLAIERLNSRLDNYAKSFDVSVCYVMNNKGFVIASSNRNSPDSFLGRNYAFRPYFKDALKKGKGYYFALGVSSGKRGFYVSYPVKGERGNIIGAAAVKMNTNAVEDIFKFFPHTFLVSPQGIIFMSSSRKFLFRSLYPINNTHKQILMSSHQFGSINFNSLLKKEYFEGDEIMLNTSLYYVFREFIGYGGWSIFILWPNEPVLMTRFFYINITLFSIFIFLLFIIVLSKRESISNEISRALSERESILNATDGIVIISVDADGNILFSNSGTEVILGYKLQELKGRNIVNCLLIKDKVCSSDAAGKEKSIILEDFYTLAKEARRGAIVKQERRLVRKDGTEIIVELSITAKRNYRNEISGFIFTAIDITKMKHIQEELKNEKDKIALYFNTASVMMVVLNKEGKVVSINKKGCEILGYEFDEIAGKDWFDNFLPLEERNGVKDIFYRLTKGDNIPGEAYSNYVSTKTGKRMILWHNAVIYDNNGGVSRILSSGDDITMFVERERELRAKADELERFHKFVVDRELKMKELKKRIKELESNLS